MGLTTRGQSGKPLRLQGGGLQAPREDMGSGAQNITLDAKTPSSMVQPQGPRPAPSLPGHHGQVPCFPRPAPEEATITAGLGASRAPNTLFSLQAEGGYTRDGQKRSKYTKSVSQGEKGTSQHLAQQ